MDEAGRPYALLMQKGSVAAHALGAAAANVKHRTLGAKTVRSRCASNAVRPSRADALREVVARTPGDSTVVLASTGFCGRELYAIDDRPNQLYMVGSMGCVLPLALGLALSRPDLCVVALDGDGAALMRMGAFATVGAYGPPNLQHLLLDNGVHDSTGGQATVSPAVSFGDVASACGYASALETDSIEELAVWLDAPRLSSGARFARLLIGAGTPADLPRPSAGPIDIKTRLMRHFRPSAGVH
jgi:phosphonopyruvate decarboxylase